MSKCPKCGTEMMNEVVDYQMFHVCPHCHYAKPLEAEQGEPKVTKAVPTPQESLEKLLEAYRARGEILEDLHALVLESYGALQAMASRFKAFLDDRELKNEHS